MAAPCHMGRKTSSCTPQGLSGNNTPTMDDNYFNCSTLYTVTGTYTASQFGWFPLRHALHPLLPWPDPTIAISDCIYTIYAVVPYLK